MAGYGGKWLKAWWKMWSTAQSLSAASCRVGLSSLLAQGQAWRWALLPCTVDCEKAVSFFGFALTTNFISVQKGTGTESLTISKVTQNAVNRFWWNFMFKLAFRDKEKLSDYLLEGSISVSQSWYWVVNGLILIKTLWSHCIWWNFVGHILWLGMYD